MDSRTGSVTGITITRLPKTMLKATATETNNVVSKRTRRTIQLGNIHDGSGVDENDPQQEQLQLEPLHVNTDDDGVMGVRPRPVPDAIAAAATEDATGASAAGADDLIPINNPLPYRLVPATTTTTLAQQQQQQQQQRAFPRQDEEGHNSLFYDTFSRQQQYHHQQQFPPTVRHQQKYFNRPIWWQSQLELKPQNGFPLQRRKTTVMNGAMNGSVNTTDASLAIEPIWLNPETGQRNKAGCTQSRSSSDHPAMIDDDSSPIPIQQQQQQQQQPVFHSVQQQQQQQQLRHNHQLDRASEFHNPKHPQGTTAATIAPIVTAPIQMDHGPSGDTDERRVVVDSFQGRPFYPPQQPLPQHIHPQQQQQQQRQALPPVPPNQNIFHLTTEDPLKVSVPPPATIAPQGTSPISPPRNDDMFEPQRATKQRLEKDLMSIRGKSQFQKKEPSVLREDNKSKRRPWHKRSKRRTDGKEELVLSPKSKPSSKHKSSGGGDTYIGRVHDMLEDAHRMGFDHIVSWQPHGRAFKIHRPEEFREKVMPHYFHAKQISSFRRWLSAWGFVKHREGADRGAFYHRYFVRGVVLSLVKKLTREEMERSMKGWPAPGKLPNFYATDDGTTGNHGSNARTSERTKKGDQSGGNLEQSSAAISERQADGKVGEEKTDETGRPLDSPSITLHENPRMLRGTCLEDIRRLLQDAVEKGFADVVSWLPDGKSFKIHNNEVFQKTVCKQYFNTVRVSSFSDCLRKWGFCRLAEASGMEQNAYYHRLFQRGKPELCRHYSRKQMQNAMKDFREEQKRQKEISWSLFPHHREEQRGSTKTSRKRNRNQNMAASLDGMIATAPKPDKLKDSDPLTIEGDLDDTEAIEDEIDGDETCPPEPINIAKTVNPEHLPLPHALPRLQQRQDYPIPFHGLPIMHNINTNDYGADDGVRNNNDTEIDGSIRNSYGNNNGIDSCHQMLPLGPMDIGADVAPDFPSTANKKDQSTTEDFQTPSFSHQKNDSKRGTGSLKDRNFCASYPTRIHLMLEDVEKRGEQHIVSWRSHGRAFKIHDEKAFESKILHRYFTASSLASFSRWLNHWGFLRMKAGKDRRCWYHRLLVRGTTELVKDFTRDELFDAMEEWRAPGKEPDFYCSGKGDELSEMPFSSTSKKNMMAMKMSFENDQSGHNNLSGKGSSAADKKAKTPKLQPQNDPRRLRGMLVENLREMLDVAQDEGKADVVSWLGHEKAFKIHQQKVFEQTILRRFFKVSKYRYFADTLRSWGFVMLKNGRDKGAFYHKYFSRKEPRLTLHLTRTQMKDSMKDWKKENSTIPDFYNNESIIATVE